MQRDFKKTDKKLERSETKLRAKPSDAFFTQPIFEDGVGHFWGILETRDYMRARCAFVNSLVHAKTPEASSLALEHAIDMLRLCRNDNFGMRWLVPSLLLRLGKEQECYDFSLWWVTMSKDGSYDWGDTSLPHLNIKDADIFEPADVFGGKDTILFTFDMLLLKIKLLLDLKTLQRSPNNIDEIATTIVQSRKEELRTIGLQSLIDRVESLVQQLYSSLEKSNANLWPVFLDPEPHLAASPEYFSSGSLEEAQIALQNSYQVWDDTQGAVDMVRSLVAQDPDFISIR